MIQKYLARNNADAILFVKPHESVELVKYILGKKGIVISGSKKVRFTKRILRRIQPVKIVEQNRGKPYARAWLEYLASADHELLFVKMSERYFDAQAALRRHVGAIFPSESDPESIRGILWRLMRFQKNTNRPLRKALEKLYHIDRQKAVANEELAAKIVNLVHAPDNLSELEKDLRALGEIK